MSDVRQSEKLHDNGEMGGYYHGGQTSQQHRSGYETHDEYNEDSYRYGVGDRGGRNHERGHDGDRQAPDRRGRGHGVRFAASNANRDHAELP